jgi:transcription initiation factor IIE alpha subunit
MPHIPIFPYSQIAEELKLTSTEIKPTMIQMRNDGLVILLGAVDEEGMMNGSGWAITEKGLQYAVENKLLTPPKIISEE